MQYLFLALLFVGRQKMFGPELNSWAPKKSDRSGDRLAGRPLSVRPRPGFNWKTIRRRSDKTHDENRDEQKTRWSDVVGSVLNLYTIAIPVVRSRFWWLYYSTNVLNKYCLKCECFLLVSLSKQALLAAEGVSGISLCKSSSFFQTDHRIS